MLNEHGMNSVKLAVTPALARNDEDEYEEEASRRIVGKSQSVPCSTQASHCIRHEPSGEVPSKTFEIKSRRTVDFGLMLHLQNTACTTLTVFTDGDWASDRPTRESVSSWVIMLDGLLTSTRARTQSVITQSSCEAEFFAGSTSRLCSCLADNT